MSSGKFSGWDRRDFFQVAAVAGLRLAILPLIQIATLPRLVVRPPESFVLTRPRSLLVQHLALLICKSTARTDRALRTTGKVCGKWTLTIFLLVP